jgi:hypothetical protein
MTEPSGEQFDQLAQESKAGTAEANNALWTATFSLSRWWFLPDGDQPGPRVGVVDGRPFLLAFTSGERARQQALAWGMAGPDGSVNVLAITPQNVLGMSDGLRNSGVFGITFDHGITGFFAPLENLGPIYEHVHRLIPREISVGGWYATYQGQEYRADPQGDGEFIELIGPGPEFQVDENGRPFQRVVSMALDDIFAVNITAMVGEAKAAVLSTAGDRMRLLTSEPDHSAGPAWQLADRDIYETVVAKADVQPTGLRADLPITPAGPALILQKVLTPEQTRACFDGRLHHIAGYVAPLDAVLHYRTPAEVIEAFGLEYQGSPFARSDESIAVLRFPLRDGTWRLEARTPPLSFIGAAHVLSMPAGAELQLFGRDGTQRVSMRYGGLRLGWHPA